LTRRLLRTAPPHHGFGNPEEFFYWLNIDSFGRLTYVLVHRSLSTASDVMVAVERQWRWRRPISPRHPKQVGENMGPPEQARYSIEALTKRWNKPDSSYVEDLLRPIQFTHIIIVSELIGGSPLPMSIILAGGLFWLLGQLST